MVAVTRNGASSSFLSVVAATEPLLLNLDKRVHPAWTGKREGVSMEDERMQKLLSKYETWGATLMSNQADGKNA